MGTLVPLIYSLQSQHIFITLVMALSRYVVTMFLIIISTNVILTKAEETKDQEDEREEKWNPENIMERVMDRSSSSVECRIVRLFSKIFCPKFKNEIYSQPTTDPTTAIVFCEGMLLLGKDYCDM